MYNGTTPTNKGKTMEFDFSNMTNDQLLTRWEALSAKENDNTATPAEVNELDELTIEFRGRG